MNRNLLAILRTIADDYEQLDYILQEVTKQHGLKLTRDEIKDHLEYLVSTRHVQTFELSEKRPHAQPVPFAADAIDELWFYPTPAGKKLVEEREQESRFKRRARRPSFPPQIP